MRGSWVGTEFARAKLNLALHVTGRRPDGLPELDGLVVFPGLGDLVEAEPAAALTLAEHRQPLIRFRLNPRRGPLHYVATSGRKARPGFNCRGST